jgi:hypothetical protein
MGPRTKSALLAVLMSILMLGLTTPASATYQTKSQARRAAKHFVRKRSRLVHWKVTWRWVEPASKCSRVNRAKVQCHYQFGNFHTGNRRACLGVVRIRRRGKYYYARWIRERCGRVVH